MMSIKLTLNYKLLGGTTEMRTEIEMISLIKDIAFKEENIRAAYIEGSRTNPNAPISIDNFLQHTPSQKLSQYGILFLECVVYFKVQQ